MAVRPILVADEDPDTRIILRALLEKNGYDIVEAANADEAMDAVSQDIGLVIMNHPMMTKSQITLARWVRAQPQTRDVPIINLTSRAVPHYLDDAARQGVTVSLVKPLDVHALLELVREFTVAAIPR